MGSIIDKYGTSNPNYKSASTPTGAAPAREMTIVEKYGTSNPNYVAPKPAAGYSDPLIEAARGGATTKTPAHPNTPNLNINAFGANPNAGKRAGDVLGAAVTGGVGNFAEALGQITQPTGLTIGENARLAAQGKTTQAEVMAAEKEKADRIRENIKEPLYDFSDRMQAQSQQYTEAAKEGLGKVGQFTVDLGVTGTQLVGDIALGALNPALGTAALATRAFGGSAQEARQAGATETQQQLYGTASAATSILVEKIAQVGKLFKGAYGGSIAGGSVDDILNRVIGKVTKNPTLQRLLGSAIGEGGEEALEALIQPALKAIYDKGEALNKTWFTDNSEEAKEYLSEVGYNALIGGTLGLVGAGGNANVAAQGAETTQNAQNGAPNAPASRVGVEVDNNAPAPQNGTGASAGANENGLTSLSDKEKSNLSSGAKNKVVSTFQEAVQFVRNAISDRTNTDRAYLGKVPNSVAQRVKQETGVDVTGLSVMVNGDDVRHILKKHGDPLKEAAKNQIPVTAEAIARIPEIIASPDSVSLSDTVDGKGRQAIVFEKQFGDTYITIQGVSNGKKLLQTDTMYIKKEKPRMTQFPMPDANLSTVPEINAQSDLPQRLSTDNVTPPNENVKRDVFAEDIRNRSQNPSVGAADAGFDRYTALENEYGTLPEKKNPYRPDDVPASITGEDRVSENAVSMKGSELTKDEFVPVIEAAVLRGDFSFQGLSNNSVVRESIRKIKAKGFRKAYAEWKSAMEKGSADPELTVRAMLMYNIAQEAGDTDLALDILLDAQANTRESARVVQINRLWQTMRPEAQLAALYRKVERISNKRAKGNAGNVPVDEWMTRVGQDLAAHIKQRMNASEDRAQTVSQTILSDLKQMYAEDNPKPKMGKNKRSTIDRLHDLLENFDKYSEAAEVAKANMLEGIEDEALRDSIGEWFDTLPEFGRRLARELTGDEGITIPDNLAKAYLSAETDEKRDEVLDEIAKKVAEQTPTSLGEIYNTLRYVNMLFNLKTQVRNVAGNSVMSVIDKARNAVAVGLQKLTGVEKTRVAKVDAEHKAIGLDDYETVKRGLESQQKYKDNKFTGDDFAMRVDDAKTVNNTGSKLLDKPLAALQKFNEWTQWMMNNDKFGDAAFLKKHYANALGGYLQAQGITAEQWNDAQWQADNTEKVTEARDFAIKQAQEKTFRDSNELSDFISTFARGKNTPAWAKAVFEGLLPFRRTPANILVRATEYSPLGLVVTGVNAGRGKLADADIRSAIGQRLQETFGRENVTADYLVEQLSKNITGTGLMAIGFILAKLGFLRGGDDDDEKQAAFDSLTGRQPYAIEWEANGKVHSYTIDWLTPAAMPLFMGAEAAKVAADGDVSVKDIGEVLLSVTDPMLELSMLQGIQDAIDSVQYSDGGFSGFMQILANAALNNVTQALTSTLGGQIERTFEPNRMTTYVDKNKDTASWKQYARGKAAAKGLGEYGQTEYIDAWGRTESNGSFFGRAVENFLSPGYYSAKDIDPLEQEIQRLYKSTGENILPDRADKKIGDVNLTAEQYTEYATTRGNEMYDLMQKVVNDSKYKSATDVKKAEMLKDAKDYANSVAKNSVADTELVQWMERAKSGKHGLGADDFVLYRAMLSTVDKPNKNGNLGTYTDDEKRAAAKKAGITNAKAIDWVIGK